MKYKVYTFGGINTKVSPILHQAGELTRSVNVDSYHYGALKKREGYTTYLGTANGSAVTDLWNWTLPSGTQMYNYRYSGNVVYYSTQGTGEWTICGNGTVSGSVNSIGHAVLGTTMIIGDGVGATRHTTSGTSFTDTTAAPAVPYFQEYQNRMCAGGTSNVVFRSVTNDPTDWTVGTAITASDQFTLSTPGNINKLFKTSNRLIISQNTGRLNKYDGNILSQVPTDKGISSARSVGELEDNFMYLNDLGFYAFSGDTPKIMSNHVEKLIYNDSTTGIAGAMFGTAPGGVHKYDYYAQVGTVTDDNGDSIGDCVLKYNYQLDEWRTYTYSDKPNCFLSYKDPTGVRKMIIGGAGGQCYQIGGNSDNGKPIVAIVEGVLNFGDPETNKKFNWIRVQASPGCSVKVQMAIGDTYESTRKKWFDLGDLQSGILEKNFSAGSRGKLLFYKFYESSINSRFEIYGFTVDFEEVGF